MWKNIFLESCLISALIFGGFYINAKFIKNELYENKEKTLARISGAATPINNISGKKQNIIISYCKMARNKRLIMTIQYT